MRGIAYMEAIVRPVTRVECPEDARNIFQGLRWEAGEEMVLEKNTFVEHILLSAVLRKLTDEEMSVYRHP